MNRRIRHPAGPMLQQRTRSASVPPRGNGLNPANATGTGNANRTEAQASSARSSPSRRPNINPMRPAANVDFDVSTRVDVVPMTLTPQGLMIRPFGPNGPNMMAQNLMAFGSPRTARPSGAGMGIQNNMGHGVSGPTAGAASDSVEPSLAALLGSLQSAVGGGNGGSSDNANMVNGVFGIMNEIRNAVSAGGNQNASGQSVQPGGERRTISAYLESLPDYTYVEGRDQYFS